MKMLRSWPKINQMRILLRLFIVVVIISFIWYLICLLVLGEYDYNQIRTRVYCDKNEYYDHKYLLFPMTSVTSAGGLGNQLFEVFSLLGLAQTLNRTAIFNNDDWLLQSKLDFLHSKLPKVAEQVITIPINLEESSRYVHSPSCCHFHIHPLLFCEQSKFVLLQGRYFQSFKYFLPIETTVRTLLKPSEVEIEKIEKTMEKSDKLKYKICVHIRRGDFLTDGMHEGTDRVFTINAIDYLYTLHPGLIYMFSNDPKWTRRHIADYLDYQRDIRVMETPKENALFDLFFSQIHCDSVLITAPSSTFGWWMGYLSKNMSNVFYRNIQDVDDSVKYQMIEEDFFPQQWKKLGMTRNGRIITVDSSSK